MPSFLRLARRESASGRLETQNRKLFRARPLAWTPAQAYPFLQAVPLLEECGIVVRLPDWWKKRNRPQVNITLRIKSSHAGESSQFNLNSLLAFDVQMALGEEPLSETELQQLLNLKKSVQIYRKSA